MNLQVAAVRGFKASGVRASLGFREISCMTVRALEFKGVRDFRALGLRFRVYLVLQTDVNPKAYSLLSPVIPISAWSPKPRLYIA